MGIYESRMVRFHGRLIGDMKYSGVINSRSVPELRNYVRVGLGEGFDLGLRLMFYVDFGEGFGLGGGGVCNFFVLRKFLEKVGICPKVIGGECVYFILSKAGEAVESLGSIKYNYLV